MRFLCCLALQALLGASAPDPALPELLLSRQLVEAEGLAPGDVVEIQAGSGEPRAFRVRASYEPTPDPLLIAQRRYEARLHLGDLAALLGRGDEPLVDTLSTVNLALEPGQDGASFRERLAAELSAQIPGVAIVPARGDATTFLVVERFHLAIALVTVLGSSAFLLALMVMRADERREIAGALRLVGFTRRRVLLLVLVESLGITLLGALLGVMLARVSEWPVNAFFQAHYDTPLVFLRVSPSIALRSIGFAVPLGVAAGLIASWAILRKELVELLRR